MRKQNSSSGRTHANRHIWIIGSVTKDVFSNGEVQLGGSGFFISELAIKAGLAVTLSTCTTQPLADMLGQKGVDVRLKEATDPLTFAHRYRRDGSRRSHVESWVNALSVNDLPTDISPDWIIVCPNFLDVDPAVVSVLDTSKLTLLPQGYLRDIKTTGEIVPRDVLPQSFENLAMIMASEADFFDVERGRTWLTGQANTAVMTHGQEAVMVSHRMQTELMSPSIQLDLSNPTGAGDTLAFYASLNLMAGMDPFSSLRRALLSTGRSLYYRDAVETDAAHIEEYQGLPYVPTHRI